jgi:hypothetical protein
MENNYQHRIDSIVSSMMNDSVTYWQNKYLEVNSELARLQFQVKNNYPPIDEQSIIEPWANR